MGDLGYTIEGLASGERLRAVYRKRNVRFCHAKVSKENIQSYLDQGWQKTKSAGRTHVRLRKPKEVGPGFEDYVWCILTRLGFEEMNAAQGLVVPRFQSELGKQVDVFARDGQCICLIECKAASQPHTKRQLDKDIDQIAGIRSDLVQAISAHYRSKGSLPKFKFVWMLALKNIDLSDNDEERAKKAGIRVLTDADWQYYDELSQHFGDCAKYQFLADMLPGAEIPDLVDPIPALKGKLGDTVFYSFVIEPAKLLKIAYVAHRAKTVEESRRTYQRMARKSRLRAIAKYIHEKSGLFPTNIVLNINTDNKPLRFDVAAEMAGKNAVLGTLHIPNRYRSAWVIDGQHRLFAYSGLEEATTATLPVIAFEDLDPSVQARLFIDINGEQVRVSKNLLNDLYADYQWNSENPSERLLALTNRIVRNLNTLPTSPFKDRIINVGGRKTHSRTITPTAVVTELKASRLVGHVNSRKAKEISPGLLSAEDLDSTLARATEVLCKYYRLFLTNQNVEAQWNLGSGEGGYICTNQGIIATVRVLKAVVAHIAHKMEVDTQNRPVDKLIEDIAGLVAPVVAYLGGASAEQLKSLRSQYAEAGVQASTFALLKIIRDSQPDFDPPGLREYVEKTDTTYNTEAYEYLSLVETLVHENVVATLKSTFGEGYANWWHKGVKQKVRESAVTLANQDGEYSSGFERFLHLIDLKVIIEDNWDLFASVYTIGAKPTESRSKRLGWFNELNTIRNIVDHPPKGGISKEQLEFAKKIFAELSSRLESKD